MIPKWPLCAVLLPCAFLTFLSGCGYIGEPLPPLMNIPGRGENITAVQRGSNIIVHVTLPALTTEGVVLKQTVRLDLRVGLKPNAVFDANAWAAGAKPAGGAAIANGVAEYKIPAAEWVGKQVAIAVKVIGTNKRDAGWSPPTYLAVMPPPAQPRDLAAESAPQGVRLTWQGDGGNFAILRRGPDEQNYAAVGRSTKPEYIDGTAQFGKEYRYMVQAMAKSGDSEAQSDLSNEAAITPQDTFPPSAPVGLTGVPSTATIELVWERSPEPTVVGYRVYRAMGSGTLELLADKQVLPAFSDRKVESGKTYRYAVSAVKSNKLESKLSDTVEVAAP